MKQIKPIGQTMEVFKTYRAVMLERKTAERLKKAKPLDKNMSQFIEELLKVL